MGTSDLSEQPLEAKAITGVITGWLFRLSRQTRPRSSMIAEGIGSPPPARSRRTGHGLHTL